MIVDSSALVAVILQEPGWERLLHAMKSADRMGIAAPTLAEAGIVLSARLKRDARPVLARFAQETGMVTLPFGESAYVVAMDAWLRFGKGRHPAALNFGDCISYATASVTGEPLLCVGQDFPQTDLPLVPGSA